MKKLLLSLMALLPMLFALSGCSNIGDKATSMSIIYCVTAILSLLLLLGYCLLVKKKEIWFLLLFSSVSVVNIGYFTLSISKTLEEALLANRISYLGSVFLPLSMLMIILSVTKLKYKKWLPALLFVISILVFFVAASPGYLNIYYSNVSLENINGVTVLNKEYGPWHSLYLVFLLSYFVAMIATIIQAFVKKKLDHLAHCVILAIAVFVNICVWLLEQLVNIDFEFLSVSYIISELFLLGLHLMIQEHEKLIAIAISENNKNKSDNDGTKTEKIESANNEQLSAQYQHFETSIPVPTPTEKVIFDFYLEGKSTKEIMAELNITENTLKYHNKNIYSKLGVSSRKQLLEIAKSKVN